jgi:putative nucleotidyltransferase with HDIG domain
VPNSPGSFVDRTTAIFPVIVDGEQVCSIAIKSLPVRRDAGSARLARGRSDAALAGAFALGAAGVAAVIALAGPSREIERRRREAQTSFVHTLKLIAEIVDLRDPYTAGHSQRVAHYSRQLARELKLSPGEVDTIENAALLHDLGKIAIPDDVLFKTGPLDDRERAMINTHPEIAARLLQNVRAMQPAIPYIKHHHERVDGAGYPDGLKGDYIPYGARIIAVADTFDAMTSARPYRPAFSLERATAELHAVRGTQLDAGVSRCFLDLLENDRITRLIPPVVKAPVFGRKLEIELAS